MKSFFSMLEELFVAVAFAESDVYESEQFSQPRPLMRTISRVRTA